MIGYLSSIASWIHARRDPVGYARSIGVKVGHGCRLIKVSYSTEPYLITIGNHVSATRTHFETHDGGVWVLRERIPDIDRIKPIDIGDNVYIGIDCLILPGVKIGNNVVIGARSVVTKNIPDNVVAIGAPARVIKSISEYESSAKSDSQPTKRMNPSAKRAYYESKYSNERGEAECDT